MKDKTTGQARDLALRKQAADGPVTVDTAMRRCAAMYLGATGRDMRRLQALDLDGRAWWLDYRAWPNHT